jgi:hypothetical protein
VELLKKPKTLENTEKISIFKGFSMVSKMAQREGFEHSKKSMFSRDLRLLTNY